MENSIERAKLNFEQFGINRSSKITYHINRDKEGQNVFHLGFELESPITSKSEACTYAILVQELNDFLFDNYEKIFAKTEEMCNDLFIDKSSNESQKCLEAVLRKYFMRHLKQEEIEILCKIEREKSSFYPSAFEYRRNEKTKKYTIYRKMNN